ncbi:acyl-CoA dehydrogenase family protein [Hoeflea prorocentri]|uniref:Acyl-CoA dehydrogenase family protein n=1 Tax=Hoeflea prorocentri TaxID=1922333 RepID=A0A9X3ZFY0_9HYPH|nr:acyl-CoA dehydrogenase family protein [Hoeflea prorocentri]MCY6379169.1 acyl-CoA dehydrogenase family protein [Hoeflea prorocentri]MDA5396970.1 acyl-CoA dehydrogenase family protein [Hoeflea prorocentri]
MQLTQEHEQLRSTVEKFIETDINPYVDEWEAAEQFPAHEVFAKLGKLGLLGIKYDPQCGGLGLDFSYSMVMAEALGSVNCGGVPMAIGVQTDMCTPALNRFGTDELKQEWLTPSIAGDMVGCIGVSEAGGGSDVAAVKTMARVDGDDYVINGSKMWITNGMQADWCCLLANTGEGPVHKNKSLIMVPLDAKGVERQKIHKIGMHSSDTAQLFFDDVRVQRRNLVGQEGMGFTMQMLQFQEERLWVAASSLLALDRLIDQTIDYTRDRKTFGRPILDNQAVHFRLSELRTEVEALRALTWRAIEDYVNGKDATRLASMAKLKSGRLYREVADSCLQYWGGMGFTADNPVSRAYRDGRLGSIGGGADEIMLGIICKLEGTLPAGD